MAGKAEVEGQGIRRVGCGGAQLGVQCGPSSDKARIERSSGRVAGWYLPVLVVDEKRLGTNGVRVLLVVKRVAVGKVAGGFEQAVGIRSRKRWYRHKMSRKQLVGIIGQRMQAGGGREVLVEVQEVWEGWTGQV